MKKILLSLLVVMLTAVMTASAQTCGGYDFNQDGKVNSTELEKAITDYQEGSIDDKQFEEAINCYSDDSIRAPFNPGFEWTHCGDLDNDGDWDVIDFIIILLIGFFLPEDPPWPADLDCDGKVTDNDLKLFAKDCFRKDKCPHCCPPVEASALSPVSLIALAGSLGLVAAVIIRRR